jgi:7-cyano-7-deazaguanine synthase
MNRSSALVLFSGGQDSTTCLAWALDRFERVETIGFDYGQRHRVEIEAREVVLAQLREKFPRWAARMGEDHMLDFPVLGAISNTGLTREVELQFGENGLPNTFVPGRNLLFLNLAAAVAYRRGIAVLVGGMCETDFSGYPDCREDTIKSQQITLSLGMDTRFLIETPLMWIDKAQTWQMANELGGAELIKIVIDDSHTCYVGDRRTRHEWGAGCGDCPACQLRRAGFERWKAST